MRKDEKDKLIKEIYMAASGDRELAIGVADGIVRVYQRTIGEHCPVVLSNETKIRTEVALMKFRDKVLEVIDKLEEM